jgi:hypothetical protein
MRALIKRFSQETPLHLLTSLSFLGASLSIELAFLSANLQFLTVITTLILSISILYRKLGKTFLTSRVSLTISLIALSLNPFSGLAALFTVSLLLLPAALIFRNYRLYTVALLSHVLDMSSTYLLLPSHSEANIFVRTLIDRTGLIQGLLISKTFLIVLPLAYSYRYLEKGQRVLFVKFVFVLGVSMAFRNLIVFF